MSAAKELQLKLGCVVMLLVNLRLPSQCEEIERPQTKAARAVRARHLEPVPSIAWPKGRQVPLVNGALGVNWCQVKQILNLSRGPIPHVVRHMRRRV